MYNYIQPQDALTDQTLGRSVAEILPSQPAPTLATEVSKSSSLVASRFLPLVFHPTTSIPLAKDNI
jgi:hypothetical protein